jgi:hypothetical protein
MKQQTQLSRPNRRFSLDQMVWTDSFKILSMMAVLLSCVITLAHADEKDLDQWFRSDTSLYAVNDATAEDTVISTDDASGVDKPPPTRNYPTLGHRELGEHVKEPDGTKKIWPHALPIFGQKVLDLGVDFPRPYGVSLIGSAVRQEVLLSDLRVSLTGPEGPFRSTSDFVSFSPTEPEAIALEAKFDFWLFPFMNVYGILGAVKGEATVPITVGVEGALDFLGLGGLCPDNPPIPALRPDFCDQSVNGEANPKYDGINYGIGTILAMGWKHYFVTVPITYVYSDLDILQSTIETLSVEILFGRTFDLRPPEHQLEIFVGGSYLDASFDITNSVVLPLSDADPSLSDVRVDYKIEEENADKWNFVVGGQYQFSKRWAIQGQVGFLGSRQQLTFGGVFRF